MLMVLWYRSDGPLSRLIRWVTRSPYSHVAILVGGCLYEALGSGVVKREGAAVQARIREAAAGKVIRCSRRDAQQVQTWLEAHVASRYSILGFLSAGIGALTGHRILIKLDGRYICSELAAQALIIAGIFLPHDAGTITPADLATALGAIPLGRSTGDE